MATTVLNVPDISYEHCERTITNALTPVAGIRTVHVDICEKQARMEFDAAQVSVDRMKDVLQEEDYPRRVGVLIRFGRSHLRALGNTCMSRPMISPLGRPVVTLPLRPNQWLPPGAITAT